MKPWGLPQGQSPRPMSRSFPITRWTTTRRVASWMSRTGPCTLPSASTRRCRRRGKSSTRSSWRGGTTSVTRLGAGRRKPTPSSSVEPSGAGPRGTGSSTSSQRNPDDRYRNRHRDGHLVWLDRLLVDQAPAGWLWPQILPIHHSVGPRILGVLDRLRNGRLVVTYDRDMCTRERCEYGAKLQVERCRR